MFGLFKKKIATPGPIPAADAEPDRYVGRPLLIVLENYVLDSIGALPPDKQLLARAVVQKVWGGGADWRATVRAQLNIEAKMDQALIGMWARNQELAKQNNQSLEPVQFAKMVVDQNFASLV